MISLVLAGVVLCGASGVPGLIWGRRSSPGERVAAVLLGAGCACGIAGALARGDPEAALPWPAAGVSLGMRLDGISAMFLVPVFAIAGLGALYGLRYWPQTEHPENGRRLRMFYGLMAAGMALLVVAKDGLTFLLGWELMANGAYFTLTAEDEKPEVRRSGLVYLVCTHTGTLALLALFGTLRTLTGSWDMDGVAALGTAAKALVFGLALVGFGLKAGVMPLHIWLPGAHADAPSHVSALMSGVVIKMGIYGLVRIAAPVADPPLWWGGTVLALGVVSGVLGVAFAIGQHDIKRLLAYHSVENIGIIAMGLGLALMGRSLGRADLVALGLAGALLHTWNHGLFKSLLFLSAGAVVHATGTREIDRLGGLSRRMPLTSLAFLTGAVAICGLPPLNGFVSEFLVYMGLFHAVQAPQPRLWLAAALAAPALALVGGLALACFVKVYGATFLGEARSAHGGQAREAPGAMLAPMGVLAALCALIGLAPVLAAPLLDRAVAAWAPGLETPAVARAAPLAWVGLASCGLALALAIAGFAFRARLRAAPSASSVTWGCGYLATTARMQYTSSSFAETIVRLFRWALCPDTHEPRLRALLPAPSRFESRVPDTVLDRGVLPACGALVRAFGRLRWVQGGVTSVYLLYILVALVLLFLWR